MEAQASGEQGRNTSWTLDCAVDRKLTVQMVSGLTTGEYPKLTELLDSRRTFVVTTATVDRYYGERFRGLLQASGSEFSYNVYPFYEKRKSLASVERLCEAVQQFGLDRKGVLIALGGGVCSDIVTLAAALVRRGIQHIRIPTTLIGQVDAGIGLKGGVNFAGLKNYLGCFYPPMSALIDTTYLRTLSRARIREGLAEILKLALVADRPLFDALRHAGSVLIESRFQAPALLARQIMERSIHLMLEHLQENPYEDRAEQRLVDMGHTFSPVLEAASAFRLPHGEAVAIDMAFTCTLAELSGIMRVSESEDFVALLMELGLPVVSPLLTLPLCQHALHNAIAHRGGRLNMVTPVAIGAATFLGIESLPDRLLQAAIDQISKRGSGGYSEVAKRDPERGATTAPPMS